MNASINILIFNIQCCIFTVDPHISLEDNVYNLKEVHQRNSVDVTIQEYDKCHNQEIE